MHIPGFTEEDIRSALTIEDEENLTQDQIDTLTGIFKSHSKALAHQRNL